MALPVNQQPSAASREGFESITLRSPDGRTEAEFVPEANMLCCSLRHHGAEILDSGSGVGAYAHRGATMGIPLLHPWANRLASFDYDAAGKHVSLQRGAGLIPTDEAGLPIHGVLPALMRWEVSDGQPHALTAVLRWTSSQLLELFPFEHQLRIETQIGGGELTIATTLYATGQDSVPVCFGYHPYLRILGAPRDTWWVTLGAFRRLVLDEDMIPTGEREPIERRCLYLEGASLDDGFDALSLPAEFEASAGNFALTVEFVEGFPYAQVYAPCRKDYVCFEPMTAPANALRSGDGLRIVGPGDLHRTVFRISIRQSA
jgi:galactose mutarotase-like enzyme